MSLICPIPKQLPGIVYGSQSPKVVIDLYVDPVCPDCVAPVQSIKPLVSQFKDLQIRLHNMALSYHTWAFVLSRAILSVGKINQEKVKLLIEKLYVKEEQEKFNAKTMMDKSQEHVTKAFIDYASKITGIAAAEVQRVYDLDDTFADARIEFKSACLRGVSGTPTWFTNGVISKYDSEKLVQSVADTIGPFFK